MSEEECESTAKPSTIYEALSEFGRKCPTISKDGTNPFTESRYTTLGHLWSLIRPVLDGLGVVVVQSVQAGEYGPYLQTVVALASSPTDQNVSSNMLLSPEKATPQAMGSAVTYARRYAICALLNITDAEVDDDGNEGSGQRREPVMINDDQVSTIYDMKDALGMEDQKILDWLHNVCSIDTEERRLKDAIRDISYKQGCSLVKKLKLSLDKADQ